MRIMSMMAGALALATLAHAPAMAAEKPVCVPRHVALDTLAREAGERPIGAGIEARGSLVLLMASPDGGSWTLLVVSADGKTACVAAIGNSWVEIAREAGESGA